MKCWLLLVSWIALFFTSSLLGFEVENNYKLTRLADTPDWSRLTQFNETMSASEFVKLLDTLYSPDGSWRRWIRVEDNTAYIRTSAMDPSQVVLLILAESANAIGPGEEVHRVSGSAPLSGWRIGLDPGHIGGQWAEVEQRSFSIAGSPAVREGDLVLRVAHLLRDRLEALGAEVRMVKETAEPVTTARPNDFLELSRRQAMQDPAINSLPQHRRERWIQQNARLLFYRTAEIRARGRIMNQHPLPNLVLCLHIDAAPWPDPTEPTLVQRNHTHMLINGAYSADELEFDDVRLEMLIKLLLRTARMETAAATALASSFERRTQVPPFRYGGGNALNIGGNPYVWARNLLANRIFEAPVVFLEPYVANSREVFPRIQAGEYEGLRWIDGLEQPALLYEYVDAVVDGLIDLAYSVDPKAQAITNSPGSF